MDEVAEPRSRRTWFPWLAALLGIVAIAVGAIALVVAVRDDDGTDVTPMAMRQLAAVEQACEQWRGGARSGAPGDWCGDMTAWMGGQMRGGGMSGSMMWGDPDRMRDSCERWTTDETVPDAPGAAACGDMVEWMRGHVGEWHAWLDDGRMTAP
jgi:hypothetical protein